MRPLDPAIKSVWRITYAFWSLLFFGAAVVYDVFHLFGGGGWLPAFVPTGIVLVLGLFYTFAAPRLRYRYWRFDLRPDDLYLERGVFNRVRTIVPLRRIQHLDVSQNLVERNFDLGKLVVHTAGTRSSDVVVPGLAFADAERLRDEVRRYITDVTLSEEAV